MSFTHLVAARQAGVAEGVATFLSILFSLNLLLGSFNLLPIPPLDGFGAIGLLAGEEGALRLQRLGQQARAFSMIGLIVAWRLFDYLFDPIFVTGLRALYPTL